MSPATATLRSVYNKGKVQLKSDFAPTNSSTKFAMFCKKCQVSVTYLFHSHQDAYYIQHLCLLVIIVWVQYWHTVINCPKITSSLTNN